MVDPAGRSALETWLGQVARPIPARHRRTEPPSRKGTEPIPSRQPDHSSRPLRWPRGLGACQSESLPGSSRRREQRRRSRAGGSHPSRTRSRRLARPAAGPARPIRAVANRRGRTGGPAGSGMRIDGGAPCQLSIAPCVARDQRAGASQTRAVPSLLAAASQLPSGLKAT